MWRLRRLTGIKHGNFSFTYLGCPVFYGRGKNVYFEEILRKISRRIFSWHNKLLSYGGRQILINHVLQSIPVYLLTVMNPPKRVIEKIHQLFAKFLWSSAVESRVNTGLLGMIYVILRKKVALDLGLCMM